MYFWTFKELNYQRPRNCTSIAFVLNLRHGNATQAASLFGLASVLSKSGREADTNLPDPQRKHYSASACQSPGFSVYCNALPYDIQAECVKTISPILLNGSERVYRGFICGSVANLWPCVKFWTASCIIATVFQRTFLCRWETLQTCSPTCSIWFRRSLLLWSWFRK